MSFKSLFDDNKDVRYLELRDVCEIRAGIRVDPGFYRESGFPFITVANIQGDQIITDNLHYCDPANHPKAELVKYGDVVMARWGSAGRVGINLTDKELFFSRQVLKFVPKEDILISRYLYHFLLSQPDAIKGLIRGSTIPGIRKDELGRLKIPVPSLEVQERIAQTLDKFREIEREINLRDKQYEYYRNYLISGASKDTTI